MDALAGDEYEVKTCELCIVGAGAAGLNALYAASQYLSPEDRVIMVDRKASAGGMWTETYDYVRLHQPHRMFTAGDIAWKPKRPPAYLAAKHEVLDHLSHCIDELRDKVTLEEIYGFELVDHAEVSTDAGYQAQLRIVSADGLHKPMLIKAKKCIKAFGFRVPRNAPLAFSSDNVRSVSPHSSDLVSEQMQDSRAPVFIVGGGKTAMDTAHMLINRYPNKEIHLVIGDGTVFVNRDKVFPKGLGRWFRGSTSLEAFADIALRFNGENESEVFDYYRDNYCVYLDKNNIHYVFGILSPAENETIANGISSVTRDYVTDIIDRAK